MTLGGSEFPHVTSNYHIFDNICPRRKLFSERHCSTCFCCLCIKKDEEKMATFGHFRSTFVFRKNAELSAKTRCGYGKAEPMKSQNSPPICRFHEKCTLATSSELLLLHLDIKKFQSTLSIMVLQ